MKRPINYKPKYSLSIFYLKKIMPKRDFDLLLKKYVAEKVNNWENYSPRNPRKSK
jgi:hypothetical protein